MSYLNVAIHAGTTCLYIWGLNFDYNNEVSWLLKTNIFHIHLDNRYKFMWLLLKQLKKIVSENNNNKEQILFF